MPPMPTLTGYWPDIVAVLYCAGMVLWRTSTTSRKVAFLKRAQILVADVHNFAESLFPQTRSNSCGGRPQLRGKSLSSNTLNVADVHNFTESPLTRFLTSKVTRVWQKGRSWHTAAQKLSVQKSIRNKLIETFLGLDGIIDSNLPKKENFKLVKCREHLEMIAHSEGMVQFVKHRDLPYIPTLRLLHKYPFLLPQQQVDKSAIKFVLNSSHIMCPGLTSPGARLLDDCPKDVIVAIMGEGKEHAMAIGLMKMSSAETREKNTGIAIDNVHYLNDGLWRVTTVQ